MLSLECSTGHAAARRGESEVALYESLLQRAGSMREWIRKGIPARFQATISADDVLQEVWIRAFQALSQFEPQGPESTDRWLNALTSHALTDALKAARTQKRGGHLKPHGEVQGRAQSVARHGGLLDLLRSPRRTPSREAHVAEAEQALRDAVQRLKGDRRRAVELHYLNGLTQQEVAQRLDRSEAAVNSLLFNARCELRRLLGSAAKFFTDGGTKDTAAQRTH